MINMDAILSLIAGSVGGGVVIWLLRNWLLTRLQRSIEHDYARKLETHKAELNSRLAALSHRFEVNQLRTSLFFDHRRVAFSEVLAAAVQLRDEWLTKAYDPEAQVAGPVPLDAVNRLEGTFYAKLLFLDRVSVAAVELFLSTARRSLPVVDFEGEHPRDADGPLEQVSYMLPLIADLFRDRLGLEVDTRAGRKLALLGAIQLVNRYHFPEIGLPIKGDLRSGNESPADAVVKAERHVEQLLKKLHEFQAHLEDRQLGVFHEAAAEITRYLDILALPATARDPTEARLHLGSGTPN